MEDTLKNNIVLGDENITDEQIRTAAKEIGFENTLNKFKNGLDEKYQNLNYLMVSCK